jgi:CBS-domain-containing membrane protein
MAGVRATPGDLVDLHSAGSGLCASLGQHAACAFISATRIHWHGLPLSRALLDLLHREGLAGATVFHGVAGFGAHSRIHTRAIVDLATDLPVVIEVVDRPDRLERVMPMLEEMVTEGLITEEEVTVRVYRHRELKPLTGRLLVSDVMTRDVTTVPPTASVAEVIEWLAGRLFCALPVVDEAGRVVGIITNDELIARGGLPARLRLLERPGEAIEATAARSAAEALHLMVARDLKRLPVVDRDGRLVGMLSRVDLLRAADDGYSGVVSEGETRRVRGTVVADVMRRDPATVPPDTPVPEVIDALLAAPTRRVLATDDQGRLLGIISDADLLARLEPAQRSGLLARLLGDGRERQAHRLSVMRAADVMNARVVTIGPDATLEAAIRRSLDSRRHLLPVVDATGRLAGLVSRAELLAALAPAPGDGRSA